MKAKPSNETRQFSVIVRCTQKEHDVIFQRASQSTCRSFSEYARKMMIGNSVMMKTYNVSLDALIEAVNGVRQQLDKLIAHEGLPPSDRMQVNILARELQVLFNQIADQCTLK
jgi:hypothetical protein